MDEEVDSVVGFFRGLVNFLVVLRCSVYLIGHRILESIFKSKICSFFSGGTGRLFDSLSMFASEGKRSRDPTKGGREKREPVSEKTQKLRDKQRTGKSLCL